MRGDSVTTLTRNLQQVTGATYRRAELIAVDQTVKIRSDITSRRQQSAGITRFRWSTSQDSRVAETLSENIERENKVLRYCAY